MNRVFHHTASLTMNSSKGCGKKGFEKLIKICLQADPSSIAQGDAIKNLQFCCW